MCALAATEDKQLVLEFFPHSGQTDWEEEEGDIGDTAAAFLGLCLISPQQLHFWPSSNKKSPTCFFSFVGRRETVASWMKSVSKLLLLSQRRQIKEEGLSSSNAC